MARDGNGTYSRTHADYVAGATIESSAVNGELNDFASEMTSSIAKDGQTVPTANLPMGGFKHTNTAAATSRTDYARASQVADNSLNYAADTGTATAYAIAPSPGISAYAVGQRFTIKAANANTGADPTLAVNGLTAGIIKWPNGTSLAAGDIAASALFEVVVSATTPVFHLQSVNVPPVYLSGAQTISGNKTFTGTQDFTGATTKVATATQATNSTTAASSGYVDRVAVQQVVSTITGAVATGTTAIPQDDTIPQNTEGDQYMSLAITPKSATSKLRILVVVNGVASAGNSIIAALFQDTTASALAAGKTALGGNALVSQIKFEYEMTSGTTSATTFKVRAGGSSGTFTFNGESSARILGGALASSILIEEIGI